ncbi:MAG: ferrous iron transporter B [Candidatus Marinamargulisbacteria bacterium]
MRCAVLFGPPNAGKSTLFNHLTGRQAQVVNYPGSTVDVTHASLRGHPSLRLIDVPGVQSFLPQSDDEKLSLKAIAQLDQLIDGAHPIPDLVICVIDATQRSRHLAMAKRLIDDGYPIIVVITMMDEAHKKGIDIDHVRLSQALGVSVFKVMGRQRRHIGDIADGIALNSVPCGRITRPQPSGLDDMLHAYDWAETIMSECESVTPRPYSLDLDRVLLHPVGGYIIFVGVMVAFFSLLFFVATPFVDGIEFLLSVCSKTIFQWLPDTLWRHFLINGLLAGVGGVLVFVPQIALLFLGMGIMEATGFLARSAALIDKPLSKIGLNGRSFVPLLSGCACAIPAILATRTIPNKRVRYFTMAVVPLMQCSARLPVYGLLLGALFSSPWQGALGLTAIYMASMVLSGVLVGIANRWVPNTHGKNQFMIQLPTWRWPDPFQLIRDVTLKTSRFLTGAGPIILGISIILWGVSEYTYQGQPLIYLIGQWIEPLFKPMGVDWRVGVAILLSFTAREVFVSALAVVFQVSEGSLFEIGNLSQLTWLGESTPLFTTSSLIGLVLFFMIAMQCGATWAVLKKEMGQYKWPTFILVGYIGIAYGLAVLVNQL